MQKCDFNCEDCTRTLCTQGNPTLEPTPEELEAMEEEANRAFFGSPNQFSKKDAATDPGEDQPQKYAPKDNFYN